MPTAATLKRPAEARALAEAERLLAQTNRSGVRVIAPEIGNAPDASGMDMSNAVTKVHRAIELDAFLPPTLEVSVVVSEIIALVGAPRDAPGEAENAPSPFTSSSSPLAEAARGATTRWSAAAATASDVPGAELRREATLSAPLEPSVRSFRARRLVAALLFAVVMAGALVLLVTALSRRGWIPAPALRGLEWLLHAGR